jgi:uncharacterized C2H2 Zn-finger protein
MSATKRAAIEESRLFSDEASERSAEFESLLKRLRELEHQYKLGNVDSEIENHADSGLPWLFEEELSQLGKLVRKYEDRLLRELPSWYYKFISIEAEAKDYFDKATSSYLLDMYLLAQELYRELPKHVAPAGAESEDEERKTLKNMIRVIIAGLEYLYSIGDFGTAITYAQGLHDFVVKKGLATKDNPAYGTLAVIYHFLGRAHRQRGIDDDYQQAIDYFYQSSENYFEMARRRGNNEMDVIYARTRAMVSLAFGAGFLFYNAQSDLVRAKAQIAQARLAFLKDNGEICCQLHYHYLELLYASILRAEAGEIIADGAEASVQGEAERAAAIEKLDRAGEILARCGEALENKPKYFIHVLYNKALVYLYQGPQRYDEARASIDELLRRCGDKPRWLANGLILKSHLERRSGNMDLALADAMKAYNQAGNHLPVRIEALLARGQAQLGRQSLSAARADFEKALQLNNGANLKLNAMARLLLLELAIEQQKPQQAHEGLMQVKALMPSIRHGFIINKYRQLEARMGNLQTDFIIPAHTDDLDYKRLENDLQRWLLERALRIDSNLTRIAQRLNVSKKTVYIWLDKYKMKP